MAWMYYAYIGGMAAMAWLEKQLGMGFPALASANKNYARIMNYFAAKRDAKAALLNNMEEVEALAPIIASVERVEYVIQPGDTLSQLAITFHTSVGAIAAANNIQNVNLIRAGAKLVMPSN